MKISKYLIFGGGMVAGHAAKQFVESGLKPGELTILSADSSIPYERPSDHDGVEQVITMAWRAHLPRSRRIAVWPRV